MNASCPVIFDNKVFISASYRTGGALLEIRPDFTHRVVWTTQEFGLHLNTPIYRNGFLYGFDGRNEPDASLACVDAATGKAVWRETPEWNETFSAGGTRRQQLVGTYRGSLLAVDGQFLCLGEMGHLLWMDLTPKGYKEISRAWLFAARESWALPVLSRGLALRRAEHARCREWRRAEAAVLRHAGVRPGSGVPVPGSGSPVSRRSVRRAIFPSLAAQYSFSRSISGGGADKVMRCSCLVRKPGSEHRAGGISWDGLIRIAAAGPRYRIALS